MSALRKDHERATSEWARPKSDEGLVLITGPAVSVIAADSALQKAYADALGAYLAAVG